MIPLRDEIPTRRVPIINYVLIAANVLVYLFQSILGAQEQSLVYEFALIPFQFTSSLSLGDISDIFTSMFMHAGLAHIGGNMLYLWIFGDNVEDRMGRGRFIIFYLIGGIVASLAHIFTNPASQIPTVGASGAIAAVLGAYLVLYPQSRVLTLVPLGFFIRLTMLPAALVLGLWFVLQFFSGVISIGGPDVGGVAFWAHIGGFVTGVVLAKLFAKPEEPSYLIQW
ncbi:MAG: rhomboid family intramembrane serine protease [Anaerolineales bacterium]|nr:rhomboid family intramembrane serine protease [Chloroflexota bacterium]MBL6981212.1 rhomboid family intramembrane serine protease [Anaerolineales bacterium]